MLGSRLLRRLGAALLAGAIAVAVFAAVHRAPGRSPGPAAQVRPAATTSAVTAPATSRSRMRVLATRPLTRAAARAAFAAAGQPSAPGEVLRGWTVDGLPDHVFLVHSYGEMCIVMPDPLADYADWMGSCDSAAIYRRFGIVVDEVGGVYVGVIGPGLGAPVYHAPGRAGRTLRLGRGRIVALAGAPHGATVTLHGPDLDRRDAIWRPRPPGP